MMEIRKADSQGRLTLPAQWRKKVLGSSHEMCMILDGESLIVKPRHEPDLSRYFDSVTVNVEPEGFEEYHKLKLVVHRSGSV